MIRIAFYLISTLCMSGCGDGLQDPPKIDTPKDELTVQPLAEVPPLEERVVYEVNLRAFSSQGTFAGVAVRLDEIKSLGVNVLWLMPIHPIGEERSLNSPYSIRDYLEIAPEYGSLNDLKQLINEAHERGMAVILDWVANHTAWDHDWITENPDWYAQDANGNIISPPGFNWTDVAELNFANSAMKQEMIRAMRYWVEDVGLDGFRCDAADHVPAAFWAEALAALRSGTDRELVLLGEGGEESNFTAGFEMNYAWNFFTTINNVFEGASASSFFSTHNNEYEDVPDGNEKLRYITNHDIYAWEESAVDAYGLEGSVAAFVITSFLDGVPLIYSGQEVGYPSTIPFFSNAPIDWSLNPEVFASYQEVMDVRATLPAVHYGELETYAATDVAAFRRFTAQEQVLVLVNVRESQSTFTVPEAIGGTWTNALTGEDLTLESTVALGAHEYLILSGN